jgi:cell division transport system permease protein
LVAWLIVYGATALLQSPVAELTSLYSLDFALHQLRAIDTLAMLTLAAALGWAGAALSVRRHLRAF